MALFGTLPTVRSQLLHPAHFSAAFALVEDVARDPSSVRRQLFAQAPGANERIDLPGGAFAMLQTYATKPRTEGKWETHRAVIDVQAVFAGEEFMEVADRGRLVVSEDLTPGKDVIFYQPFAHGSVLRLETGDVAIYFPPDAHMGAIATPVGGIVRKVVVKVPALA